MPCPYFEPLRVSTEPLHAKARLPLIEEYDGVCHAGPDTVAAPSDLRLRYCNHGYSSGVCERLPTSAATPAGVVALSKVPSCLRYNVTSRSEFALDVLCVEEQNYAPLRWQSVVYSITGDCLSAELKDACLAAQLLAFCRSYLRRFPA